jgi:MOSC domain-containing protein YiiM
MKVLSINVSLPKEIDWNGRKVTTSIFKTPVEGRRHVAKLNIEGDAQSDLLAHGGEHRANSLPGSTSSLKFQAPGVRRWSGCIRFAGRWMRPPTALV